MIINIIKQLHPSNNNEISRKITSSIYHRCYVTKDFNYAEFYILMAVPFFWDVTACSLKEISTSLHCVTSLKMEIFIPLQNVLTCTIVSDANI
jgi:hypothetical protein